MSALTHRFDLVAGGGHAPAPLAPPAAGDVAALTARWDAVHKAGRAVAALAQLGEEELEARLATLPERAAAQGGYVFEMAARGAEDLAAVMQPGLRALLALTARGRDTTPAAMTLWQEFHRSREAIVALVDGEQVPAPGN